MALARLRFTGEVRAMPEGRVAGPEPLGQARQRCAADLAWLPAPARRLRAPEPVPVRVSPRLGYLQDQLARSLAGGNQAPMSVD